MVYLLYVLLAFFVVFFAIRLSYYVDVLDKKTNVSGAFIGGVLLAAVTSLPELFTALTAVLSLDKPQLVQGDVLGSNIFNLTVIGVLLLLYTKGYKKAKLSNSHFTTVCYGIVMYICTLFAILFQKEIALGSFNLNIMTIVILILYFINVKFMQNDTSVENEEEDACDLSIQQVCVRFAIYSILLVAVSILLTYVTDEISHQLNLGSTVAGAIFLGVATSLPELSASFNLVRMGNYNASFGNIVGSNLFNFTILCVGDFLYTKGGIYIHEPQVLNLIGFGMLSSVLVILLIRLKSSVLFVRICSFLIVLSYVVSIAISM